MTEPEQAIEAIEHGLLQATGDRGSSAKKPELSQPMIYHNAHGLAEVASWSWW